MNRALLSLLFLCLSYGTALSQSACEITLTRAQEEFDAGRFNSVPTILQECLQGNQNREWEQRAYLLLAETYLLLDDPAKADESYLKVLQANPEFLTDESRDPIDLVYLSKKFTATPIYSLYGKVGLNASFIRVIHDVQISPVGTIREKYSAGFGWQGAVGGEYHYSDRISFAAELNYTFASFSHRSTGLFLNGNYSVDYNERQTMLRIPVLIKYSFPKGNLRPYSYLGYSFHYLLRDRSDMVVNGNLESPEYNSMDRRRKLNRSLIVGGGLKYKWGLRYLFGEVRYSLGMTNLVNAENRYSEINQSWPYVDDDFRMDNLFVNIGYIHPFYKARMLKKPKTRSVLRLLKGRDRETK